MSLLLRRLLPRRSFLRSSSSKLPTTTTAAAAAVSSPRHPPLPAHLSLSRSFITSRISRIDESQLPAAVDYGSVLEEPEFHRLADETLEKLQERLEEYGDNVEIDGFDIDYGNQVLTLKLGDLGTYVINKQTPNRQIWLSSPVSGPSRFDWDESGKTWVYRRTKANLLQLLEEEVGELCSKPITLS